MLGDGGVGKSAIRERFLGRAFKSNYLATIGADFATKSITINDISYKLQIWDLAGQQHFSKVRSLYYKGSHAYIIVYDVTRIPSFENVLLWIEEIIQNSNSSNFSITLAANKIDLRIDSDLTHIPKNQGIILQKSIIEKIPSSTIKIFETSAKTNENIEELFLETAKSIIESEDS